MTDHDAARRKVLDTIGEMFVNPMDEIGADWFTVNDVADEKGITYRKAYDLCEKKVTSGEVERKIIGRCNYYKFIEVAE